CCLRAHSGQMSRSSPKENPGIALPHCEQFAIGIQLTRAMTLHVESRPAASQTRNKLERCVILDCPMPRYEYRKLEQLPDASKAFDGWIEHLDREFANKDVTHRSEVVRDVLHELYLGRPYEAPRHGASLAEQTLIHSFDPRNATLEPEYYGDVDGAKYAERKPLIWFWMMYDRSPLGLNHHLGYRVRYMLAKHIFKHIGKNVKIFHGVEVSFGYNLTVEDNCTIHKYVLLDDRGEVVIRQGSSVSDYANIYSH